MKLLHLALASLSNRRLTSALTVVTVALSVLLLLGVERIRTEAREGFTNTISGTDLIVGARSGSVQLLLYSVFHIGNATNNIAWDSYLDVAGMRGVKWALPISLGDSHRGYRVMGTTREFFAAGAPMDDVYDAVVGAEVADRLQYVLGQSLVIAHGGGSAAILDHADKPFRIAGILAATGTPVDRTVVVSLEGIEAMHAGWSAGVQVPSQQIDPEAARRMDLVPETVTAILVGLTSRVHTFKVQRLINEYPGEPLLAILPGIALQELWRIMGVAENALLGVSILVVLVGLGGMMTALLTSLNERRREIAILRSVGARPGHVVLLLATESVLLAAAGCLLGMVLLYGMQLAIGPWMADQWGILLSWRAPNPLEWGMLGAVLLAALLAGLVPGYRAYRYSLSDGLMVRT